MSGRRSGPSLARLAAELVIWVFRAGRARRPARGRAHRAVGQLLRQQREQQARQKRASGRAEMAMEARLVKQALRDRERAVRGYMSAGLTADEAATLADRMDDGVFI